MQTSDPAGSHGQAALFSKQSYFELTIVSRAVFWMDDYLRSRDLAHLAMELQLEPDQACILGEPISGHFRFRLDLYS